jgi:hypothetical protein
MFGCAISEALAQAVFRLDRIEGMSNARKVGERAL